MGRTGPFTPAAVLPPVPRFRLVGEGPIWGTPSEQFAVWSAAGIEYVVLENAGLVHQEALDELDARCPGAVQLQASWAGNCLLDAGQGRL